MSDSKLFKKSRVVLEDKSYILKLPTRFDSPKIKEELKIREEEEILGKEIQDSIDDLVRDSDKFSASTIIDDADAEARKIIKDAQNSSEAIILEAYDQAEKIRIKAQEDGYNKGFEEGKAESSQLVRDELETEYQNKYDQINDLKSKLNQSQIDLLKTSEKDMIEIILDIVDKVFINRIEKDEYLVETLIKQAISKISQSNSIVIRVSDIDYPIAIASRNRILTGSERVESIDFKSDSTLEQGSCIIESEIGIINSSVKVQYNAIKESLMALLNEEN